MCYVKWHIAESKLRADNTSFDSCERIAPSNRGIRQLIYVAEAGVFHKRERLFTIASRKGDALADPVRLLWHPLEWRQPDGTAAVLADTPGQCQREPADETRAVTGSRPAQDEPGDNGRDAADADGERRMQAERGQPPRSRLDAFSRDADDADGAGSQGWGDDTGKHTGDGLLGRQVLVTPTAGSDTSDARHTLNLLFVEALMCWLSGWTGFASVATEWSRWLQRMRYELWQLNCWPMDEVA